uniref:Glucosidase II subunit alpha n=1 Tax=Anoplophora glabripennis TaxID=217634 RepID=V5G0Q8_ANOGL
MENTDTSQAFSFAVEFEGSSKLYGLAHHSYQLALKETTDGSSDPFRLKNTDNWGYDADSTTALYGSIPAIYGHSANFTSGAFLHNAAQMFVDITYSGNRPSAYFMVEGGSLDLFILIGPTPKDVVRQYTSLTGVNSMPPAWALGYHQNRYTYWTQEEVKEVVALMDAADFPLDVIFLDDGYTNGNRYFQWNPENFTDPLEMQQNVSATGRHMIAVSDPHVAVDENYFMYVEGKELDFYVKNSDGSDFQDYSWPGLSVWVDFLNPAARDWYGNLFLYENFQGTTETIGGFWNDMNEPSIYNDTIERTFPPELVHFGQVTNRDIHNIYGLLHVKATNKGLAIRDNYEKRVFILSRSHFAGSQRYAAVWTGDNIADWPHLRNSISECLTFNLLGTVMCGADVGGFFTNPTDEIFQRWYQAAIWIPYFRAHSNKGTIRREPYLYPEEIQAVLRLAVKTRYKHIPYWYLLMFEHTQSGDPLIRPLFYSYPEYLEYDDHLLLGEEILARPVLEPEVSEVAVTFPGSNLWYRVDDDSWKIYEGASEQNVAVNITTSPFFYRGGSIIVRKDIERPSTTQMADDPFQLYVTLDANNNAEGRIYFDDHVSLEFSTKESYYYSRLIYDYATNGVKFETISGNPEGFNARIQSIVVHQEGENKETVTKTYTTTRDGTPLENIDIIQMHKLMQSDNSFTLYL